jgi:hypothetical protein
VAVGEDGGGDLDAVAEEAAGWGEAARDLGLDGFDDDSSTSFGRFHIVPFTRGLCIFNQWREILSPIGPLTASYRRVGCNQPKSTAFSPYDRLKEFRSKAGMLRFHETFAWRGRILRRATFCLPAERVFSTRGSVVLTGGDVPGNRFQ